jgi:NAD+ kinase
MVFRSPTFRHIALIGKYQGQSAAVARATVEEVAQFLMRQGCEVCIEADSAARIGLADNTAYAVLDVEGIGKQCDLAVAVGGDGTMLGIGRQLAAYKVPLVGINQGRLGFITDITFDSFAPALEAILAGEFDEDRRALMDAKVLRGEEVVFSATAMNDVVLNRGSTAGMIELRVEVDGRFVANQRADGLIISTPTGSTAYALSAGGPLMHPSIGGWVLVPIAPHNLSNRPIVLADTGEVALELVSGRDANANFDMQSLASLLPGDRVVVRRSAHEVRFLHPAGWSYFDILRQKLHWNTGNTLGGL